MLSPLSRLPPDIASERAPLVDDRLEVAPTVLSATRHRVEQAARESGLDDRECFAFVFAVNEAVTNAIRHGGVGDDASFGLRLDAQAGALTATVTSRAPFLTTAGCLDPWAESGRGFHYMRMLVDDVRVQSTPMGTAVHLRKFTAADRG